MFDIVKKRVKYSKLSNHMTDKCTQKIAVKDAQNELKQKKTTTKTTEIKQSENQKLPITTNNQS
jgi:hypothetical protein